MCLLSFESLPIDTEGRKSRIKLCSLWVLIFTTGSPGVVLPQWASVRPTRDQEWKGRGGHVNWLAGKIRNVRIHPPYPKDLPAGQIWSFLTLFWKQQALCCITQPWAPLAFALEQRAPSCFFPWEERGDFQMEFWSLKFWASPLSTATYIEYSFCISQLFWSPVNTSAWRAAPFKHKCFHWCCYKLRFLHGLVEEGTAPTLNYPLKDVSCTLRWWTRGDGSSCLSQKGSSFGERSCSCPRARPLPDLTEPQESENVLWATARAPLKESASRSQILLSSDQPLGWKCLLPWHQPLLPAAAVPRYNTMGRRGNAQAMLSPCHCKPVITYRNIHFFAWNISTGQCFGVLLAQIYKRKQELLGVFADSMFRKCSGKDLEDLKCFALNFLLPQT